MIPQKVSINGKPYTVESFKDPDNVEGVGVCRSTQQSIQISLSQGDHQLRDTLLHEILHALCYEFQLGLEERQVHILAGALLATLWGNEELSAWFLGVGE